MANICVPAPVQKSIDALYDSCLDFDLIKHAFFKGLRHRKIVGLLLSILSVSMHAMPVTDPFPKQEQLVISCLDNGIVTIFEERASPNISLKVIWNACSSRPVIHSLDIPYQDSESVERFFLACKEKNAELDTKIAHWRGASSVMKAGLALDSITVIAVGNFIRSEMQKLIDYTFSGLSLSDIMHVPDPIQIGVSEGLQDTLLSIHFNLMTSAIRTYEDLVDNWKERIVEQLFEQRMERCVRALGQTWMHPHHGLLYPAPGSVLITEEQCSNILGYLIWEIEQIKEQGFFENEFIHVKNHFQKRLAFLSHQQTPTDQILSSYYAEQLLRGQEFLDYQAFVHASAHVLSQIECADLSTELAGFFADDHRLIEILYSKEGGGHLTVEDVHHVLEDVNDLARMDEEIDLEEKDWLLLNNPLIQEDDRSIVFLNYGEPQLFHQLPLTDVDVRYIHSIISTVADKNIVELAFKKKELEKKGDKIAYLHPLRFMACIIADHHLRYSLHQIKKSSFKWDSVIGGFSKRMKEECARNNVMMYVAGFSSTVHADPAQVAGFIERHDWDGLVRFLLK